MLIWNGHGILIPLLAVGSLVLGFLFGESLGLTVTQAMGCSILLAAVLVLVYGRTLGKTKVDIETGYKRRHSFFFITGTFWAILLFLLGGLVVATTWNDDPEAAKAAMTPEARAFEEANRQLGTGSGSLGNSEEAQALASSYSQTLGEVRDMAIRKESSPDKQVKGSEFRTYCQLTDDRMAFLVRVPDLRKYTDEAKDFIIEMAWTAALSAAEGLPNPPQQIGVATRGTILYDKAWSGEYQKTVESEPGAKVDVHGSATDLMHSFFVDENASANEVVSPEPEE